MATPTEVMRTEPTEVLAILQRCNTEKPSRADIEALREHLQARPQMWTVFGDLSEVATRGMVEGIKANPAIKESVLAGRQAMRRELAYERSPLLEQMLIDHLILCWLRLQMEEYSYTVRTDKGGTIEQCLFWEKRLAAVQRRYLRAVETLARIRKMALPTIQVNIGDKQVNVAGG